MTYSLFSLYKDIQFCTVFYTQDNFEVPYNTSYRRDADTHDMRWYGWFVAKIRARLGPAQRVGSSEFFSLSLLHFNMQALYQGRKNFYSVRFRASPDMPLGRNFWALDTQPQNRLYFFSSAHLGWALIQSTYSWAMVDWGDTCKESFLTVK